MRHHLRSTRWVAALLLLAYLPACTSYQTMTDPVGGLQPKSVEKARVTTDSGKRFEIMFPRVNGDSLQGTTRDGAPVSVAMANVREVEVRAPSDTKVVLLVFGILLLTAGAVIGVLAIIITAGA